MSVTEHAPEPGSAINTNLRAIGDEPIQQLHQGKGCEGHPDLCGSKTAPDDDVL